MAAVVIGVMLIIKQAGKAEYNPKPLAYATYEVHLGKCELQGYLIMHNRTYGMLAMGSATQERLWALAKACGGRIEEVKNEHQD